MQVEQKQCFVVAGRAFDSFEEAEQFRVVEDFKKEWVSNNKGSGDHWGAWASLSMIDTISDRFYLTPKPIKSGGWTGR